MLRCILPKGLQAIYYHNKNYPCFYRKKYRNNEIISSGAILNICVPKKKPFNNSNFEGFKMTKNKQANSI